MDGVFHFRIFTSDIASRTDLVWLTGNYGAFAALTASGGVVAWGDSRYGGTIPGDAALLLTDVIAIYSGLPSALQGNISYQE